jgi:hypothetical protein
MALSIVGVGGPAAAAIPALDITTPEGLVSLRATDGVDVTFTLRRPNGVLKERITETPEGGFAEANFDSRLRPGDRLTVRRGGERRTITLQRLEITGIDRVRDVITGRGTPGRSVAVRVNDCDLGSGFSPECPDALRRRLVIGARGTFRLDTTGDLNVRGSQHVDVLMKVGGDRYRDRRDVPLFSLDIGSPFVSVIGFDVCSTVDGILLDAPGGTIIASSEPTAGCGLRLRNGGVDVDIESGNQVILDFATDARMSVPAVFEDVDLASDVITGTCFPGQPFLLQVFGPGGARFDGIAGPAGAIDVDTTGTADLTPANDYRLRCRTARGDIVREDVSA